MSRIFSFNDCQFIEQTGSVYLNLSCDLNEAQLIPDAAQSSSFQEIGSLETFELLKQKFPDSFLHFKNLEQPLRYSLSALKEIEVFKPLDGLFEKIFDISHDEHRSKYLKFTDVSGSLEVFGKTFEELLLTLQLKALYDLRDGNGNQEEFDVEIAFRLRLDPNDTFDENLREAFRETEYLKCKRIARSYPGDEDDAEETEAEYRASLPSYDLRGQSEVHLLSGMRFGVSSYPGTDASLKTLQQLAEHFQTLTKLQNSFVANLLIQQNWLEMLVSFNKFFELGFSSRDICNTLLREVCLPASTLTVISKKL